MKSIHAGTVALALLSGAIPLALTHCGDSNSTTGTDGGGTGHPGTSSGGASGGGDGQADTDAGSGSGGSSGSGSSSGIVVSPADGGSGGSPDGAASSGGMPTGTCQAPDGGVACDPGVVKCGSTTCNTSQTSCCRATGDAGTDTCVGPNGACAGNLVRCNETSDCQDGLICCDDFGTTVCAASCGQNGFQICRSDTECGLHSDAGASKRCILQTCGGPAPGGGPPSPVVTLEACAAQSFGGMGIPPTWGPIYGCTAK